MNRSIASVKAQYFLAYAPLGSMGPLLPIFLQDGKGLTQPQFGMLIAATALSMLVTPVVLALLADTKLDTRRLLAGSYCVGGMALIGMFFAEGVWPVSILYAIYSLAFVPTLPLTDALYFTVERSAEKRGEKVSAYQFVRIWGTYGFILPSVILYFLIDKDGDVGVIAWVGMAACLLAAMNTFRLPEIRMKREAGAGGRASLPTTDALRTLFGSGTWVFCVAMFLALMSAVTYYNFFPHYLRDAGVPKDSIGLVMNVGVIVEIFFLLGFGPMRRRLRLKGVLVLGLIAMFVRMSLLATFHLSWVGIAVQALHGLETLALYVVPMIYIDRLAGDGFRSSIQGAYMMTVLAFSRMLGAMSAGFIGEGNVTAAFQFGSALSFVAVLVVIFFFRPIQVRD